MSLKVVGSHDLSAANLQAIICRRAVTIMQNTSICIMI